MKARSPHLIPPKIESLSRNCIAPHQRKGKEEMRLFKLEQNEEMVLTQIYRLIGREINQLTSLRESESKEILDS